MNVDGMHHIRRLILLKNVLCGKTGQRIRNGK